MALPSEPSRRESIVVNCARGPLPLELLGSTLMHEHVFIVTPEIAQDYPALSWGAHKEARIEEAAATLNALKRLGIDTIVDLTVPGLGRSILDLEAVAQRVELNIVVATGYYTFDALPYFFLSRPPRGRSDVLIEMFLKDIRHGVGTTGIKAAILKCCTSERGVTPNVDRVLRAVAVAHRETGAPISTHTDARSESGLEQQRVFASEGVDLSRVVIGHSGDTTDLSYLRKLMDEGSSIGCDRFGYYVESVAGFEDRVETIARLCELGYADRIVLGHDTHCHMDMKGENSALAELHQWRYSHIPTEVVPALRQRGVSDQQIGAMLVDNPRRLFATASPY